MVTRPALALVVYIWNPGGMQFKNLILWIRTQCKFCMSPRQARWLNYLTLEVPLLCTTSTRRHTNVTHADAQMSSSSCACLWLTRHLSRRLVCLLRGCVLMGALGRRSSSEGAFRMLRPLPLTPSASCYSGWTLVHRRLRWVDDPLPCHLSFEVLILSKPNLVFSLVSVLSSHAESSI